MTLIGAEEGPEVPVESASALRANGTAAQAATAAKARSPPASPKHRNSAPAAAAAAAAAAGAASGPDLDADEEDFPEPPLPVAKAEAKTNVTSKYKGVSWDRRMKMWRTKANSVHIGYFENEVEAARAYDAAKLSLHNFRTTPRLNFPEAAVTVASASAAAPRALRTAQQSSSPSITNMFLNRDNFGNSVLGPLPTSTAVVSSADSAAGNALGSNPSKRIMTAKYMGVMWDATAGSWRAKLKVLGKTWYLGIYREQESAAVAYDTACYYVFKEKLMLNFPETDYSTARLPQPPPPWLKQQMAQMAELGEYIKPSTQNDSAGDAGSDPVVTPESEALGDVLGVSFEGGKFVSRVELMRSNIFVGAYNTLEQAMQAYDVAALRLTNGRLPINEKDPLAAMQLSKMPLSPDVEALYTAIHVSMMSNESEPAANGSAASAATAADRKGSKEKVAILRAEFKRRKSVVQVGERAAQAALASMAAEFAPSSGVPFSGQSVPDLVQHAKMALMPMSAMPPPTGFQQGLAQPPAYPVPAGGSSPPMFWPVPSQAVIMTGGLATPNPSTIPALPIFPLQPTVTPDPQQPAATTPLGTTSFSQASQDSFTAQTGAVSPAEASELINEPHNTSPLGGGNA